MTESEFLTALRSVPPLRTPHLWDAANTELWTPQRPMRTERIRAIARLTGCVGISTLGGAHQDVYVRSACEVAGASRGRPGGCKLCIATIPYFSTPPGTDPRTVAAGGIAQNPDLQAFIANTREALRWVAAWSAKTGIKLDVGWFWLNCECFTRREPGQPEAAAWNAALTALHNSYVAACRQLAPAAKVVQYERLGVTASSPARPRNWIESNYYPPAAVGDATTISLYTLPDPSHTYDCLTETARRAATRGEPVIPFIALASGFDPLPGAPFRSDWDYPPYFSWVAGAALNVAAKYPAVALYPPPFHADTPAWDRHFIAYARGAAGLPLS